jgi:hypothetical protein
MNPPYYEKEEEEDTTGPLQKRSSALPPPLPDLCSLSYFCLPALPDTHSFTTRKNSKGQLHDTLIESHRPEHNELTDQRLSGLCLLSPILRHHHLTPPPPTTVEIRRVLSPAEFLYNPSVRIQRSFA